MHYLCRASIAAILARVVGTPRLGPILTAMLLAAVLLPAAVSGARPAEGTVAAVASGADVAAATTPAEPLNAISPGRVSLGVEFKGRAALLVPVGYPLELSGRKVEVRIRIRFANGKPAVRTWTERPHSGALRPGDRRGRFGFVHAVLPGPDLSSRLRNPGRVLSVGVTISARLFPDSSDGIQPPEANQPLYRGAHSQSGLRRAAPGTCSTGMLLLPTRDGGTRGQLPRCGAMLRWSIDRPPDRGTATVDGPAFELALADSQLGSDSFRLRGTGSGQVPVFRTVEVRAGRSPAQGISVRALGDSVTAGFGYFGKTGRPMTIFELIDCRPGATVFNDACSSNSSNRNASIGNQPNYLADYGLSRNISWPAQWANEYGITDYRNYAVTGSAPSDWQAGGQFHNTLLSIQGQNPDYILLTLGANPLLSNVLFGLDTMGCALESDLFGDFTQCVLDAFETVDLDDRLNQIYTSLVTNTTSKVIVMQYHLSIPASALAYSAVQLGVMGDLLNEIISDEAGQVSTSRIAVVSPPRFDVGIDMTPVYPADFSCSWLDFKVDGPSVQSDASQDELLALHPLSFCGGPALGPPWVIDGDTGIHPSAAGYSQMAGQMPAPE